LASFFLLFSRLTSLRKKAAAPDRRPASDAAAVSSSGPGEDGRGVGGTGLAGFGADRLKDIPFELTDTKFLSPNSVCGSVSSVGSVGSYRGGRTGLNAILDSSLD